MVASSQSFFVAKTYFEEQFLVENNFTSETLNQKILEYQPQVIICHSMGAFLLEKYLLKNQDLKDSVSKIITIMSDGQKDFEIPPKIQSKIKNKQLKWINYHCFWDQALFCSIVGNARIPAGTFGYQDSLIENKFYPLLTNFPDIHTGVMRKIGKNYPKWFNFLIKDLKKIQRISDVIS